MTLPEETTVPLARWKLAGMIVLFTFGFVGEVLAFNKASAGVPLDSLSLHAIGNGVFALLMGILVLVLTNKIFDPRPGVSFNREGMTINPILGKFQFIPWSDISGFGVYTFRGRLWIKRRLVRINLVDPGKYRRPQTGYILIQTSTLKMGFDELMGLCEAYFSGYGKSRAS